MPWAQIETTWAVNPISSLPKILQVSILHLRSTKFWGTSELTLIQENGPDVGSRTGLWSKSEFLSWNLVRIGHQNGWLRWLLFHPQDKSALSITESALPTFGVSHPCEPWHPCLPVFPSRCHLLFTAPEDGGGSGPVPCVHPPLSLRATTPPLPRFAPCTQHSPGALETVAPQSWWPFSPLFSLNSDWNGDSVSSTASVLIYVRKGMDVSRSNGNILFALPWGLSSVLPMEATCGRQGGVRTKRNHLLRMQSLQPTKL